MNLHEGISSNIFVFIFSFISKNSPCKSFLFYYIAAEFVIYLFDILFLLAACLCLVISVYGEQPEKCAIFVFCLNAFLVRSCLSESTAAAADEHWIVKCI